MLLILIVEVRDIFFKVSCVSVLIQNKLTQVVIFKDKLAVRSTRVVGRNKSLTDSMDEPFRLQVKFGHNG